MMIFFLGGGDVLRGKLNISKSFFKINKYITSLFRLKSFLLGDLLSRFYLYNSTARKKAAITTTIQNQLQICALGRFF